MVLLHNSTDVVVIDGYPVTGVSVVTNQVVMQVEQLLLSFFVQDKNNAKNINNEYFIII
jgi:hypothetical protein